MELKKKKQQQQMFLSKKKKKNPGCMFLYERLKDKKKQSPEFNFNVCVLSDHSGFLIHQEEKYLRFALRDLAVMPRQN